MFSSLPPVILASASPRRKGLLTQVGITFTVKPSSIHEDFDIDLPPHDFAGHYARLKAMDIAYIEKDSLVIGADTIVVRDHAILGKPGDRKDSFSMLSSLSGRTHTVITGVSIQHVSQNVDHTFTDETHVTFKELSKEEIDYYIDRYKPFDKAGSYGIQDWFSVCVDKVEGCFYNVVGFPLAAFYREVSSLYNLS